MRRCLALTTAAVIVAASGAEAVTRTTAGHAGVVRPGSSNGAPITTATRAVVSATDLAWALRFVPDDGRYSLVAVTDLVAVARSAGMARFDPKQSQTDGSELQARKGDVGAGIAGSALGPTRDWPRQFGFARHSYRQAMVAGPVALLTNSAAANVVTVFGQVVEPVATNLRSNPAFGVVLVETAMPWGSVFDWRDGSRSLLEFSTDQSFLYRPQSIGVAGSSAMVGKDARAVRAVGDASAGRRRSWASWEPGQLVLEAAERAGVHELTLVRGPVPVPNLGVGYTPDRAAAVGDFVRRWRSAGDAIGVGTTMREGQVAAVVVFAERDAVAARNQDRRFRELVASGRSVITDRPWRASFSVAASTVSGRVVTVVLTGPEASQAQSLVGRDAFV